MTRNPMAKTRIYLLLYIEETEFDHIILSMSRNIEILRLVMKDGCREVSPSEVHGGGWGRVLGEEEIRATGTVLHFHQDLKRNGQAPEKFVVTEFVSEAAFFDVFPDA